MSDIVECVDCSKRTTTKEAALRKFNNGRCAYCEGILRPAYVWSWQLGSGIGTVVFYHPLGYIRVRHGYTPDDAKTLVDHLNKRLSEPF